MNFKTIKYEVENQVLTLTLNRPEKLNAFTVEMCEDLVQAINLASEDDEVRVIIITGAGRAFCAGMDLTTGGNVFGLDETQIPRMEDMFVLENMDGVRDTGGKVTLAMYECKKPLIAAINGPAVGIGATMPLAMDIRLASENARFGFVFTKLGIVPEGCSSWFLPRVVGISQALEWLYSAEIIEADEALHGGLVKKICAPESLIEEANALARKIATNTSSISVALTRQMIYRNSAAEHPIYAHKVESLGVFYTSLKDGKEGVSAFLQKRRPLFTQKTSKDLPSFYPWWD